MPITFARAARSGRRLMGRRPEVRGSAAVVLVGALVAVVWGVRGIAPRPVPEIPVVAAEAVAWTPVATETVAWTPVVAADMLPTPPVDGPADGNLTASVDVVPGPGLPAVVPDLPLPDMATRPTLSARANRAEESVRPEPAVLPTTVPTPRPLLATYQVAPGDRVVDIAGRFGVSPATIVRANGLADAEKLALGQELTIPAVSGRVHTVGDGETVLALANKYGVIPEAIVAANRLGNADLILPGTRLLIPMSAEQERAAAEAEAAPPKPLKPIQYAVASGDTLNGLAAKFGVSAESIRWANRGANPDVLSVGQALTIPPVSGVLHTVAPGDSLVGVASQYEASAGEIVRTNGLAEPFVIRPGDVLVVPGGRPVAAAVQAAPRPSAPDPAPRPRPAAAKPAASVPAADARPAAPAPAAPPPVAAPPPGPANGGVAAVALRQLGARYVWGGTTPAGFDCSGFVLWSYRQAGIGVPRDLWGQLRSGRRIGRSDLRPGDIVFFENTYMPGLSHNGIYVGGGRFIHAGSESTGVIISRIDDAYWGPRYVGASRPG